VLTCSGNQHNADKNFQRLEVSQDVLKLLQHIWPTIFSTQGEETQKAKLSGVKVLFILEQSIDEVEFKNLYTHAMKDEDASIRSKMVRLLSSSVIFSGEKRCELYEILRYVHYA
jgi:hypothetical protein